MDLFDPSMGTFGPVVLGCTVTNAAGISSAPGTRVLTSVPAPLQPVLTVPPGVIAGHTGYTASVPAQIECTYAWTLTNGTLTAGQGTGTVTFDVGNAGTSPILSCTVTNAAGTAKTGTATLTLQPAFLTLSPMAVNVAPGGQQLFTANQPVTWSILDAGSLSYTSTQATFKASYGGTNLGVGTYRLQATSKADTTLTAVAAMTVVVAGSPVINTFTATPAAIHAGQSATLAWSATNATSLYLDVLGNVTGTTSTVVTPGQETTYSLTASNALGQVQAWVTVKVDQIPTIASFSASSPVVAQGASTQVTAVFSNGTGQIDHGIGAVSSGVPVTVTPTGSSDFILTVTNPYGATATAQAHVNVTGPGAFAPLPSMTQGKPMGITTSLRDGRVAIIGGNEPNSRIMELFDPTTGTFQAGPSLTGPRRYHTATLCANGNVLIWGGTDPSISGVAFYDSYEVFRPAVGTITSYNIRDAVYYPNSVSNRLGHTATLLADGRVLVVGGRALRDGLTYSYWDGDQLSSGTALLVSPETPTNPSPTFEITGPLTTSRLNHVAIRLMDGRVLVAGGINRTGTAGTFSDVETPLTSAEVYAPATGIWSPAGNLLDAAHAKNPVLLPDGRVLFDGFELFDPATLAFTALPSPEASFTGFGFSSIPLSDGRVLMDSVPSAYVASLYDLALGRSFGVANPSVVTGAGTNFMHLAPLPDGTVLCAGWVNLSGGIGLASYRFDPQASLWLKPSPGHTNAGVPLVLLASGTEAQGLTWSSSGGTVDANGTFQAPTAGIYSVTATAPSGRKASALIDVHPPLQLTFGAIVLPGNGSLNAGVPIQIPVRVLYTPDQRVTWSVQEGSAAGAITPEGIFTGASAGVWHIIATSVADPTKSATQTLTVGASISLSILPATVSVAIGDSITFTAHEPSGQTYVTWSVDGVNQYANNSFNYTAPFTPGAHAITAVSTLDPTASATAILTVLPIDSFTITPPSPSVMVLDQTNFKAFATSSQGTKDVTDRVVWSSPGGTFSEYPKGKFTASMTPGTYAVQAQLTGTSIVTTGSVTVIPINSISLSPAHLVMATGEQFYLKVYANTSAGVQQIPYTLPITWSSTGGHVDNSFQFWAPMTPGIYTIQALVTGTTISASVLVGVVPPDAFLTNGGPVSVGRVRFTMTRLLDGKILITGGETNTAEIYDPSSKVFQAVTATMAQIRRDHTATLLPDGKVLLVGGEMDATQPIMAEIFDPATQSFLPTVGAPAYRRSGWGHFATLLPNGMVLLAGGYDGFSGKSIEAYDPSTGLFMPAGFLNNAYNNSIGAAALLSDGRVLFFENGTGMNGISGNPSEVYDFKSRTATLTGALGGPHDALFQAQDGKVWALSGASSSSGLHSEWFDPQTNQFTPGPSSNLTYGVSSTATELVDGSIYWYSGLRSFLDTSLSGETRHPGGYGGNTSLLASGEVLNVICPPPGYPASQTERLFISDVTPGMSILPRRITLVAGRSWPFQASSTGLGNAGFTWSIQEGASGGSVTAQGVYTAPYTSGTYHIVATSMADASKQAIAIVDVIADVEVFISPALIQLAPGSTQTFTSDVIGASDSSVTWSASAGSITSAGLFTAPATEGPVIVTSTSVASPSRSATATVVVKAGGGGGGGGGAFPCPSSRPSPPTRPS